MMMGFNIHPKLSMSVGWASTTRRRWDADSGGSFFNVLSLELCLTSDFLGHAFEFLLSNSDGIW